MKKCIVGRSVTESSRRKEPCSALRSEVRVQRVLEFADVPVRIVERPNDTPIEAPDRHWYTATLQHPCRSLDVIDVETQHGGVLGIWLATSVRHPSRLHHEIAFTEAQADEPLLLEPDRQAELVAIEGDAVLK